MDCAAVCCVLQVCHLHLEQLGAAAADLKRVHVLDDKREASSYILLALCHSRQGDNVLAIKTLTKSLRSGPNYRELP